MQNEKNSAPVPASTGGALARARDAADRYHEHSRAPRTWRAYQADWTIFETWCREVGLEPLPAEPETLVWFLAAQADAGRSPSTLRRRLAAIRLVHQVTDQPAKLNDQAILDVMRGIRRAWAKPPQRKAPAIADDIMRMVDVMDLETKRGLRDRALVLVGFAGAFRRSELVALDAIDLQRYDEGLRINIRYSKTDQEHQGQYVALLKEPGAYCPVAALDAWCAAAEIRSGALFPRMHRHDRVGTTRLTDQSVALIVKHYAHQIGEDSSTYAGHSLRRGFLTSAGRARANVFRMADQSRHRTLDILRQYVAEGELFEDHPGVALLHPDAKPPSGSIS